MSKSRFSQRIDITIAPELLRKVDASAAQYHSSRSAVIRWALHEWLERHPARNAQVNSNKVNTGQSFHSLIGPDMSPDELLTALEEYEATQPDQV